MRAGQRTTAARMARHLCAVPDPSDDTVIAYSLGVAAERERWQNLLRQVIDAIDNGTLDQFGGEL